MLNVGRKEWFRLGLIRLLFLAVFLLGTAELVLGVTSNVLAAGRQADSQLSDCTSRLHEPYFGSRVVVETNEVACNDLTSFGGTVAIDGILRGKILAFGSNVVVTGTVYGNIYVYGGKITLQSGSHVHGNIYIYGGQSDKDQNSQLDGSIIDRTGRVDDLLISNGGFSFPFWSILTWVALGMLLTSLLPEHVMLVRTTVVHKMRRSFIIGLLSILLAPLVMVVSIALILSIPLAIIVALGLIAAWALGTVAIGWLIGDHILRRVAPDRNKRSLQVVVGLTVLVLAGSIPYIGWLISMGVGMLGLGAVLLSRFGTRLYGQPKHPIILS